MTPEIAAELLNVPAGASRVEIDKQFRKQARAHHPDLLAGASAETITAATSEFVRMSAARDVLYGELDRVAARRTDAAMPPRPPAAARQAAAPGPANSAAPATGPSGPSGPATPPSGRAGSTGSATPSRASTTTGSFATSGPAAPGVPGVPGAPGAGAAPAGDPRGGEAREVQQPYQQQRPAENPQAQFGPRAGWTTRGPDDPYIRRGPVPPPPSPIRRTPMDPRDSRIPRQAPGTASNPLDPASFQYPPVQPHPPAQDPQNPAARPNPQYGAPLPVPIDRRRAFVDRRDPGRVGLPYPNDRRRPPADRRDPRNADTFPDDRHTPHPDTFYRASPQHDPGAPGVGTPPARPRHSTGSAAEGDVRAPGEQAPQQSVAPPQPAQPTAQPQQSQSQSQSQQRPPAQPHQPPRTPAHEERRKRPASFVPPGFVPAGGTPTGSLPAPAPVGAAGLPATDPQASPMSFADFVLARDAQSWIPYVENTLPPTPPRRAG
ncbi:DnaJ domain-containing protein [Cryobacterium sp. RTS3]|uniref:J domain-containing protein n=1 Tax=Cryobacterium sp. RTS3 TaxID=3048643 RepID=UPI002B23A87A|nr:DnaJ domain-containing protein [Cryobacterium sp. RTS3]MEB0000059.1 DnaJ domain-containing protein [Cryobacterium sp. RTS3]